MNVFIQLLASDRLNPKPDNATTKFDIEDNVGEGIHIHLRNIRIEMSVADFEVFAEKTISAQEELENGNRRN